MDSSSELKPCPFCGSSAVALVGLEVRCGNCTAVGPFGVTGEQAVKRWNERVEGRSHNEIAPTKTNLGGSK